MTVTQIPDVILERYRLNELPPAEAARVSEALARDPGLQTRIQALDRSDRALAPQVEAAAVRVAQRRARRPRAAAWLIPAAAATAVAVLILAVRVNRIAGPPDEDRIKGAGMNGTPSLALYRRTAEGSEQLADGAVAHAGDLVRVGYRAAGHPYGVILSIDGAGTLTRHLPVSGDRATTLDGNAIVLLDTAYELDDAPRWERFYFVTGESDFEIAPIVRAARAAAARSAPASVVLELPRGLQQATFTLQKESRP